MIQHVEAADENAQQNEHERHAVAELQKETKTEQNGGNGKPDEKKHIHAVPCRSAESGKSASSLTVFLFKNLFHIVNPILWFRNIPLYIIVYHLHAKKQPRF